MTQYVVEVEERVGDGVSICRFTNFDDFISWQEQLSECDAVVLPDEHFLKEEANYDFMAIVDHIAEIARLNREV